MLDTTKLTTQENINLSDTIGLVSPKATPLFSLLLQGGRKITAGAKYHVWREKTLDNSNATALEGAIPSFVNSGRKELNNVTQIFLKGTEVSGTAQATTETGVTDLLLSEINDRQVEIAIAIEKALLSGSKNDGSNGEARTMDGLINWVGNTIEADSVITEKDIRSLAKALFEAGNEEGEFYAFVNADMKEAIDEIFADKYSYVHKTNEFGIVVDEIQTSFGTINVVLDRFVPKNQVIAVNIDALKLAMLREPHYEELAKLGDKISGQIIGELTLECASKKAVAVLNFTPAV
ncbi:SU10 major capsid protein [Carnobacterium sp. FSL W8-0810]|uniref:SU10 major capsid protein n=1 Tax=Carnobacterium sp. FSL W8-0810 TaxID=2954705 RepID=UPI0030FC542E